ncbi:hypothetical protein DESC_780260 [Desulfosarcina cetonica]|nr:hypothetical protein DESC_780260 [Desulfosarcina cetonica]
MNASCSAAKRSQTALYAGFCLARILLFNEKWIPLHTRSVTRQPSKDKLCLSAATSWILNSRNPCPRFTH